MAVIRDGYIFIPIPVKVPGDILVSSEKVQWEFEVNMIAALHNAKEKALAEWPETWKRLQEAFKQCGVEV